MKVYCIYDRVAQEGGPLFCAKNEAVAVRNYNNLLSSSNVDNVSDYSLYCLGEYDSEQPSLFGDKVPTLMNTSEDYNA